MSEPVTLRLDTSPVALFPYETLLAAQRDAGPLNAVVKGKDGYWRALKSAVKGKAWNYGEALKSPTRAGHTPSSDQVAIRLRTAAGERCGFDFAASPDASGWTLDRCGGSGENVEHKPCAGCAGWGPECWSVWSAPFTGISKAEWAGMTAADRAAWCAAHGFGLDEGGGQ